MRSGHALVLFSGGQDSTTCLAWALSQFAHVETIGFDYGQRHHVELQARHAVLDAMRSQFPQWSSKLGDDHMLDLSVLGHISDTALTSETEIQMTAAGLPNTFVPGRNLLFLGFAATLAYRRGASVLVGGMCETDFSGYPDCRRDTLEALEKALNMGMAQDFVVETPLMWLTKAQTWGLAQDLGGEELVQLILEDSHTCYRGARGDRHDWGHGCGDCPACDLRAKGWREWVAAGRPGIGA